MHLTVLKMNDVFYTSEIVMILVKSCENDLNDYGASTLHCDYHESVKTFFEEILKFLVGVHRESAQ